MYIILLFSVGRAAAKRNILCVNEIGTWIGVPKDTSPNRLLFYSGGYCEPFDRQAMVQSGKL